MTDVICFECPAHRAEELKVALNRDFYKPSNQLAIGEALFDVDGDKAVFFCPVVLPIGGYVGKMVLKTVWKGLKSSAEKAKGGMIVLKKRKYEDEMEALHARLKDY